MRKDFVQAGVGDYVMIETMKYIPGCTDFRLNNGIRLDVITTMEGLQEVSFEASYEIATIANMDGVQMPFLHTSL